MLVVLPRCRYRRGMVGNGVANEQNTCCELWRHLPDGVMMMKINHFCYVDEGGKGKEISITQGD